MAKVQTSTPSKPKEKPSIDDLLNQIYEWRERTITEIRIHDRKLEAEKRAAKLFD